jgi:cytidylate kinase
MPVLTISREYGSEGRHIAEQAAQALGYHFVDKRTIEDVLLQYGFVEFLKDYDSTPGFLERLDPRRIELVNMLNRVIRALAQHDDVVILGRGSFALLGGLADVLNVRVKAPLPLRVQRQMAKQDFADLKQAEAAVKENDRIRTAFIESFYNVRWDSSEAFDVVVDTGRIDPDMAATWLVEAINALKASPAAEERTARALDVDSILANTIADTLKCQVAH